MGDPGYDAARKIWNGMVDKHTLIIARCLGVSDVMHAVRIARGMTSPSRFEAEVTARPGWRCAMTAW